MEEKKTFYVTTPIYYPSGDLHIGHTYTTVAADTLTRFKKLTGYDAYFLTGTDEHGQKIQKVAEEKGVTPQAYVDDVVGRIKELWKLMNINYDQFIRTTDPEHEKTIQQIFKKLYDQGDIYKGKYEGWYCTPCESFWTESQLVDGNCPDCGRPVTKAKEEAYFFNMQKYADRLIQYIEEHPDFIQPESRRNEMLNNFLRPGLQDLCISRTTFKWGIPVDFDDRHVIYVWLDALTNYITSLGYDPYLEKQPEAFEKYWPATHIIGKDILRFHTIYWPIFLMALGLPLPKKVFGHPWLLVGEGKMSKSKGNVIYAEDLAEAFGVDAVRYFCLHEMPYANDGTMTWDLMIERVNSDLANILGNLVSRTLSMSNKYFDGLVENDGPAEAVDEDLKAVAEKTVENVEASMDSLHVADALDEIFVLLRRANKYVDETTPWILGREEATKPRLKVVLYNLLETLRIAGVLLENFMPETGKTILDLLNTENRSLNSIRHFGGLETGGHIAREVPVLFARIDAKKFMKEHGLEENEEAEKKAKKEQKKKQKKQKKAKEPVSIEDFGKLSLKAGRVLEAWKHPNAEKLLVEKVDLGDGDVRQIVSGIASVYAPEDLVGKNVVVVANLLPAELRGEKSEGMILCAEKGKSFEVVFLPEDTVPGSVIR